MTTIEGPGVPIDGWLDPPKREAKERRWPIALPRIDLDGVFAFLILLTLLFIIQLGTLGAALFAGLTIAYGLVRLQRLPAIMMKRAFLLMIPILAVVSAIWSEAPKETIKYGVEFGLTVAAGLLLSASVGQKSVLHGMFLAFGIYALVSLMFGQYVAVGAQGQTAFAGLNGGKNLLADIASTGLLISAAVLVIGLAEAWRGWWIAAALIAAAQLILVVQARSAGAMLGLFLALGGFLVLVSLRSMTFAPRATFTALLGAVLLAAAVSYRSLSAALIEFGTRVFDKDPSLTGRTYLWNRAGDLIAEKPWLGKGFHAFWLQGNPDAEGMWRYAGISGRSGFNFHNTYVELLVHLGWVGLVAVVLVGIVGIAAMVRRFLVRPSLTQCFWMAILVYQLVRTPIESIGLTPFYFSTVLLFAAFGAAFAPPGGTPDKRPVKPVRQVDVVRSWNVDDPDAPRRWTS